MDLVERTAKDKLRETVLNQLGNISAAVETKPNNEIDWRDEMAALHEALSWHKVCVDRETDTYEDLYTQICLSEIKRNDATELRISLLVRLHLHKKQGNTERTRSWRHVEVDVFPERQDDHLKHYTFWEGN